VEKIKSLAAMRDFFYLTYIADFSVLEKISQDTNSAQRYKEHKESKSF